MIPPEAVPAIPVNILDFPGWSWATAARAAVRPEDREAGRNPDLPGRDLPLGSIFSTFAERGEPEPEVWPHLPPKAADRLIGAQERLSSLIAGALLALTIFLLWSAIRSPRS